MYNNEIYNLLIFQKSACVTDLNVKVSNFDFGECYNKIKNKYNLEDDLIIAFLENFEKDKNNPALSIEIFHPKTKEKIDALSICRNDEFVVNHNIYAFIDENNTNYDILMDLLNNEINIFDPNVDFYTDLCYYYLSPKKKDIPLKDRLSEFYPNITLCDSGCKNIGINMTSHTTLCECKYSEVLNNSKFNSDLMSDTMGDLNKMVSSSNIEVLKCLTKAIKKFTKEVGGFIILSFFICSAISALLFYLIENIKINSYIHNLYEKFKYIILKNISNINSPPPKKDGKDSQDNKDNIDSRNNKLSINNSNRKLKKLEKNIKNKRNQNFIARKYTSRSLNKNLISSVATENNNLSGKKDDDIETDIIFFERFLAKSIQEMGFHDAYKYDQRTFYEIFSESICDNVKTINTFFVSDPFMPITLKIVIYILNITLYFVINGIFYSENYISEVYHSIDEEKFFSFIPRSIKRFLYTLMVGGIIQILIHLFMIEENRFKKLLIRNQNDLEELKLEVVNLIRLIQKRLLAFFIIVLVIFIFSFLYVISFNYVYHYTQFEWIKSSIFIFIIMELLIIIICLLSAFIRKISFKCKSDRLYKLSQIIDEV